MISIEELLRTFLPAWLFDYFEVVQLEDRVESLHVHLDEKKIVPKEFSTRRLISHYALYFFSRSVMIFFSDVKNG